MEDLKPLNYEENDDFSEEDYGLEDENEEELVAVSLHDETIIFNRVDGSWYMRTYPTKEMADKVYNIEKVRISN